MKLDMSNVTPEMEAKKVRVSFEGYLRFERNSLGMAANLQVVTSRGTFALFDTFDVEFIE